MFERRLKIVLALLVAMTAVLVVRAAQLQLMEHNDWTHEAQELMRQQKLIETTRGRILDYRGREIAADVPCIDACVDYRAITDTPEEDWVSKQAMAILRARNGTEYQHATRANRKQMLADQVAQVRQGIGDMWQMLAQVSGKSSDEIDDIRRAIVRRIEMRRRYLWYYNYEAALKKHHSTTKPAWYSRWLSGDDSDAPKLDDFIIDVAEQAEAHVILHAIDPETNNLLAKNLERFPGLVLRPSKHRLYPFGESACHVMGRLVPVDKPDMAADPNKDDDLRKYWPNDLVGRGGIEALCESALRGTRGRVEMYATGDDVISSVDPVPGRDVRLTLDIELQTDIEQAFVQRREYRSFNTDTNKEEVEIRERQHGAAVIIDVATGEVRAMVSYPGFDPNTLDTEYSSLLRDDLNQPLFNRATQAQLEPGSTVKTIVGCGAITHGFATPASTIECTGYLMLNNHQQEWGKCWTARQYEHAKDRDGNPIKFAHHAIPEVDPHPTGFLTVTDAIQRSCNVQFETLANRMGLGEVRYWFDQFGLGRPTGIGISEAAGHIPNPAHIPASHLLYMTCFAGIGQGDVRATPIQMANVAATLARNGVWMRPRLVTDMDAEGGSTRPVAPDRVDLHISPEALEAVKTGMVRVVNTMAGTGKLSNQSPYGMPGLLVAGKTGSAQAAHLTVPIRDGNGQIVLEDGREKRQVVDLGTPGTELWYVGVGKDNKDLAHAWFIGFAPADHPKIAFCVMVEYGGSGGRVAGSITHDLLEACEEHGYLPRQVNPVAAAN